MLRARAVAALLHAAAVHAQAPAPLQARGDALPDSLTGVPGDAARGREIVRDRRTGLCLLCHSAPIPEERFQGDIGPDLRGIGSRLNEGQIRLRIADPARLNQDTLMPSYLRTDHLNRVAAAFQGKPVLSAAQIEDVVAYLGTLKQP